MSALDFDQPGIAITEGGARIRLYPGEHETAATFSGELLDPTEREMRGGAHISCMWDRSKVIRIDRLAA